MKIRYEDKVYKQKEDDFKENFHKRSDYGRVNYFMGYGQEDYGVEIEGVGVEGDIGIDYCWVFIIDVHKIRYDVCY